MNRILFLFLLRYNLLHIKALFQYSLLSLLLLSSSSLPIKLLHILVIALHKIVYSISLLYFLTQLILLTLSSSLDNILVPYLYYMFYFFTYNNIFYSLYAKFSIIVNMLNSNEQNTISLSTYVYVIYYDLTLYFLIF